ncbi:mannose-6-phosphate isomerase [Lachnospiraceae bacterium KM106-2]|nr:mannose-6-phosphate isomerase [Lachnospiraceae bacterium KM106-2]
MLKEDFVWGVATSAYQIEGAAKEDGKGESIWDVFCKEKGKIYEGQDGEVTCDHYHHYKEDVAIMKQLGIKAYRFSLSWSRILPDGIGHVNQAGIDFYDHLIDELLANGIEPYLTMFHWDLPNELHKKGGWLNPDCVKWFGEYAKVVAEHFSDRVKNFITLNEPECFIGIGYVEGSNAPGYKAGLKDTLLMAHNALKAHGQAVIELRKYAKQKIYVGYAPTCGMASPETNSKEDIEAARRYLFSIPKEGMWTWNVSWFNDPVFLGTYPEEGLQQFHDYLPTITKEDMELIHQPLDFMGQNIYNGVTIRAGRNGEPEYVERKRGYDRTQVGWPVTPECMYWGTKFLYERYKMPMFITENGIAVHDMIAMDGRVHDPDRITFLNRYLVEVKRAVESGVDIRGYFVWTLLDNFEWDKGYSARFGLVYVDFESQKRIVKDSGFWYQKVIESNGGSLKKARNEILHLKPIFKENIWGGKRLKDEFGYEIPSETTGECWAVCAHEHGSSLIREGTYQGMTLSELYTTHRELFGNLKGEQFPLLVKIIDANHNLSIQVHPDDEYARIHENGSLGKMECWYILDCPKDATIIIGHHAKTREELKEMIENKQWKELIREIPIHKGDMIQINPGTVHAIKEGTLLLETQENSDITYRLYDYDRLQNGKPRELHLKQSMDVIQIPHRDYVNEKVESYFGSNVEELIDCKSYMVWRFLVKGEQEHKMNLPFMIMSVIEGNGFINGQLIHKGDHFILPHDYKSFHLSGAMTIIASAVKQ